MIYLQGFCGDLPVQGIQVILGNHLAGARIFDVATLSSSPVAVSMPSTGVASPGRQMNSTVGPACVVTRSQSHADHHTGKRVKEELKSSSTVCIPLSDFLLSVTRRMTESTRVDTGTGK